MVLDELPPRIRSKIDVRTDGHWMWLGYVTRYGYGRYDEKVDGKIKPWAAHRLVWQLMGRELPPHLHHHCHVKACVNPDHLTPTTVAGHNKIHADERTHCKQGHLLDSKNTYYRPDNHLRQCRKCNADRERRRLQRLGETEKQALSEQRAKRRKRQLETMTVEERKRWTARNNAYSRG